MNGWRAKLGFLIPPGNPTVEPEMFAMAPAGVSVHFSRMISSGLTGAEAGLEGRTQDYLDNIDSTIDLLALAKPGVIALAFTAGSYALGQDGEVALTQRTVQRTGIPFITAFGSVLAALSVLGVTRLALGTPYGEATTQQGKAALQSHGLDVVNVARLMNVSNIYEETPERAYNLARSVDTPQAQAIFLSGVGMPTVEVLDALEQDLGKPVISAASAMMWNALRTVGVTTAVPGYGRLLGRT
jgi:maleate isomerase